MLDPIDRFIYAVVFPLCFVLAYRNFQGIDFRLNVCLWSIPVLIGDYIMWSEGRAWLGNVFGAMMTFVLFVAGAYGAASLTAWMKRKWPNLP